MGSENKICFLFHSTHPRRVWLGRRKNKWYGKGVSIHTHTKDVTLIFMHDEDIVHVSIHTPTKGVTINHCFYIDGDSVSIHTPTKGVTSKLSRTSPNSQVSIHTPTKGVTSRNISLMRSIQFQSTHPRRVWPTTNITTCGNITEFQSTHPRRVWLRAEIRIINHRLFQSTHPRRVWHVFSYIIIPKYGFQSTHPRRVWPNIMRRTARSQSFNPHTHEGCDFCPL